MKRPTKFLSALALASALTVPAFAAPPAPPLPPLNCEETQAAYAISCVRGSTLDCMRLGDTEVCPDETAIRPDQQTSDSWYLKPGAWYDVAPWTGIAGR